MIGKDDADLAGERPQSQSVEFGGGDVDGVGLFSGLGGLGGVGWSAQASKKHAAVLGEPLGVHAEHGHTAHGQSGTRRLPAEEFLGDIDYELPVPDPQALASLPDPRHNDEAMKQVAKAVTGDEDWAPCTDSRAWSTSTCWSRTPPPAHSRPPASNP